MSERMVELSPIFLFGTERSIRNNGLEETAEVMARTLPTGELVDEPWMNEAEALRCARAGEFVDDVWGRWVAMVKAGTQPRATIIEEATNEPAGN